VASGASIKPASPARRSTAKREALNAGDVPRPSTCRAAAPGTDAGGAIGREALDAGTVARGARTSGPPLAVLRPQLPHRFQAEVLWMTS
jgi:hypothetical protein